MNNNNRSNILLVEILIAIFFFMLSATVLLRVFATARTMTVRAGIETRALREAQNLADTLYAAQDPEEALRELEFVESHGVWTRDLGEYSLYVAGGETGYGEGTLWEGEVKAFLPQYNEDGTRRADEELFTLPCVRYKGVRA